MHESESSETLSGAGHQHNKRDATSNVLRLVNDTNNTHELIRSLMGYGGETIGLLQVDDRAKDRFTPEMMALLEHAADQIALALAQRQEQAALRASEERYQSLFQCSPIPLREEDHSQVKRHLDAIRTAGVTDFREYFHNHPEAVHACAAKVRIVDLNQATLDLHQATSKEQILASLHDSFTEETWDTYREMLIAIAEGATQFNQDIVLQTLQGEKRHVLMRWIVAPGCEETLAKVYVTGVDITERKQAESRVRHLNEVLRAISDIGALIVRERNPKTLLAEACRILVQTRGYQLVWVGEVVPDSTRVIAVARAGAAPTDYPDCVTITWDDSDTGRGPIGTALRERRTCVCQDTAADPRFAPWREAALARGYGSMAAVPMIHGERLFGAMSVYADRPEAFDEEELGLLNELAADLAFVLQSIEDEHQRNRAEETLCESEQRLRSAIETSPDAIVLIELDGTVSMANKQAALLSGYRDVSEVFASGMCGCDFLIPEDRHRAQSQMSGLVEQGIMRNVQFRVRRKDGEHTSVEINASLQRDAHGEPKAVLVVARDISDRTRTEDSLRRAKQAAEAANRAKSEFLANMSHEIRTPMTAILGFSDLLLTPNLPYREQREFLDGIQRNGKALMELIGDILDLARIEADKLILEWADCSLRQMVEDVFQVLQLRAQQKGLSLEVGYRFPLPERIRTDPTRLRQILVNLVGNAIKFTDRGGVCVTVACQPGGNDVAHVKFAVSDTGIGIPADKLGDLFQPFTQVDASSTRRYGGTGLGLAISKRLAKALGGDVEVASEFGKGSTFTLTIDAGSLKGVCMLDSPLALQPAAEGPSTKEETLMLHGRVLFAEDSPAVSSVANYILKRMGLEVAIAADGEAACEMAEKSRAAGIPYDLILMDIQMPKLNGYEATRWLRQHGWRGPIVAVTAHALVGDRDKCLDAGCDDYLAKPFTVTGLQAVLARYVGQAVPPADRNTRKQEAEAEPVGLLEGGFLNAAKAAELVGLFVGELPARAETIEQALKAQDLELLKGLAHQLKGTAGIYGFTAISDAARLVHQEAKEEMNWERLQATVAELVQQCKHASAQGPGAS